MSDNDDDSLVNKFLDKASDFVERPLSAEDKAAADANQKAADKDFEEKSTPSTLHKTSDALSQLGAGKPYGYTTKSMY